MEPDSEEYVTDEKSTHRSHRYSLSVDSLKEDKWKSNILKLSM